MTNARTRLPLGPDFSGYHSCPCRDCFQIAIGGQLRRDPETDTLVEDKATPALCQACEAAGCDASGESECDAPGAYGCDCDEHEGMA